MKSINLQEHSEKKNIIIANINKVLNISNSLNSKIIAEYLENTKYDLEQDNFKLVVLGEFSRGKSTFINALLGARVFPSATKPTTAIINKISFGENPAYFLVYRNGNRKEICLEEFNKLVAPFEPEWEDDDLMENYRKNITEIGQIAYAEIHYPSNLCIDGVEIFDTPGTNDIDSAREELTFNFIPQSDVAIMLLSATQILSACEMNFIRERIMVADIKKVFFVINFRDNILPEKIDCVMEYALKNLQTIVENPKIFCVSSKGALNYRRNIMGEEVKTTIPETFEETGFDLFESSISDFLVNERGRIKLLKPIHRIIRIIDELINNEILLKICALGLSVNQLETKINKIQPEVENAKRISAETLHHFENQLAMIGLNIKNKVQIELENICIKAVGALDDYKGKINIEDISRTIEATVAPLQAQLQITIEKTQLCGIEDALSSVDAKLGRVWEKLQYNAMNSLAIRNNDNNANSNVELEVITVHSEIAQEVEAKTTIGTVGIGVIALFAHLAIFALPVAYFGGKLLFSYFEEKSRNKALGQIRAQVSKRYSDVIPDIVKQFEKQWEFNKSKTVHQMKEEFERKINSLQKPLVELLEEKRKEELNAEKTKGFLLSQKCDLENVKKVMSGYSNDFDKI